VTPISLQAETPEHAKQAYLVASQTPSERRRADGGARVYPYIFHRHHRPDGAAGISIKNSIDAKYRADASYFANQIIAQMWVDRTNIDSYANYATSVTSACTPSGSASSLANVTGWATQLASALPGADAAKQSIIITTPITGVKQVTVMVCWKAPQSTVTNNFVTTAQINI